MIVSRAKYREALTDGIKENIPTLKTVKVNEHEITVEAIQRLLLLAPFCLVMTSDLMPVEEQRLAGEQISNATQDFSFIFGARTLLSDKEQGIAGCEELLDSFRQYIDGRVFVIDEVPTNPCQWLGDHYEFSVGGLFVFSAGCRVYQL
jgi:hypothetical protein